MNDRIVDIVIPVQRDAAAARRCLRSVLASDNRTRYAIIVVADPGMARQLAAGDEARDVDVTFVRRVEARRDRDVVLLQPDAQVTGDWLDRLHAHARAPRAGVIGTFTNAAATASYPRDRRSSPLPAGESAASLDARFARLNAGERVAASGIRGPCVYLTRECIDVIASSDIAAMSDQHRGMPEFVRQARNAGWTTCIAGDVFVQGDDEAREPDDLASTADADARSALRRLAGRVDLERLAESPRPAIVFISHGWGGGVRRCMNDLATLMVGRVDVLYVEPGGDDTVKLHWPVEAEGFAAWFRLPDDLPLLAKTLHAIGVVRLHFHHVHGLPQSILQLPQASGLPYDWTLHDYVAICPRHHLTDDQGRYCGDPATCPTCHGRRSAQWNLEIGEWRSILGASLRGAARVIAPSQDVAERTRQLLPGLAISVWPHPERASEPVPAIVRVVTLGTLSPDKGLRVVEACAADARARNLPLVFRVLGSATEPIAQAPAVPLTIHGSYDDAELPRLLAAERPDALMFPAQWPETYSYTLSAALATDLPIVASDIGAFTERLAGRAGTRLLRFDATAREWNDALLAAAASRARPAQPSAIAQAPVRATT